MTSIEVENGNCGGGCGVIVYQIRAIKDELGENDEDDDDVSALEKKMQEACMPPHVWKHAQRELRYQTRPYY